ncbi:hypothetical protein BDN71DRAFT_1450502 [Pleurotus eryngii]|uniref:DUF6534 domain-containing protein n=1 Tax=Pleurotus eryngii TaxID=5323 RepID=A0A9P5ZU96_PLEER|nr:hypothetical protein BDN71DRAFT_1450502 [Pleurotus eryngii]
MNRRAVIGFDNRITGHIIAHPQSAYDSASLDVVTSIPPCHELHMMTPPVQLPIFSVFAELVSPLLIGTMIACPLSGVAVAQAIWYFRNYPQDSNLLKYWVAAVVFIDGVQTFSVAEAARVIYLRGRLSLDYSNVVILDLYVSYITVTMVQLAYAYRVWILSGKNRYVTSALALLTFCQFTSGIGMAIIQQINGDMTLLHNVTSNAFGTAVFSSTVACDLLISASMAYYLNKHKRRSGIRRTENLLDGLIVYVIGIGLLTSVFAILDFVTWVALPKQLIFLTFHSIISKLYVNSLLVTLNARSGFRAKDVSVSESMGMSVLNTGASSSTA